MMRWYRLFYYVLGLCILALGLVLNSKTNLGVSAIVSIAFSSSILFGQSFANMTLLMYIVFIGIQIGIHIYQGRKKATLMEDGLQIVVSLCFTRFMDLISIALGPLDGSLAFRLLILGLAIVCTGVGAALSLNMKLIPNPGDGIVGTLAEFFSVPVGRMKNYFDCSCVLFTIVLCYVVSGQLYGIGLGTIVAMIGVGRMISLFNHVTYDTIMVQAGLIVEGDLVTKQ